MPLAIFAVAGIDGKTQMIEFRNARVTSRVSAAHTRVPGTGPAMPEFLPPGAEGHRLLSGMRQ